MPRRFWIPASGAATGAVLDFVAAEPALTTLVTAWRFATSNNRSVLGDFNRLRHGVQSAVGNWNTTTEDAESPPFTMGIFRTPSLLGRIPAGTWTLAGEMRGSGGAICPDFRVRWKAFRSRDGVTFTPLHSATVLLGPTFAGPSSGALRPTTSTFTGPDIDLVNERLWISVSVECRETLALPSSGNTRDMNLRSGPLGYLEVPDILPIERVGGVLI